MVTSYNVTQIVPALMACKRCNGNDHTHKVAQIRRIAVSDPERTITFAFAQVALIPGEYGPTRIRNHKVVLFLPLEIRISFELSCRLLVYRHDGLWVDFTLWRTAFCFHLGVLRACWAPLAARLLVHLSERTRGGKSVWVPIGCKRVNLCKSASPRHPERSAIVLGRPYNKFNAY